MNKETFNILLEIQSCSRNIMELNQKIEEKQSGLLTQKNIDRKLDEIEGNKTLLRDKTNQAKRLKLKLRKFKIQLKELIKTFPKRQPLNKLNPLKKVK